MVSKSKAGEKKGKINMGKLNIKKETVKDLTTSVRKRSEVAQYPKSQQPDA